MRNLASLGVDQEYRVWPYIQFLGMNMVVPGWCSLVAHLTMDQEVTGSSPVPGNASRGNSMGPREG